MSARRKVFENPLQQYWRILVKRRWTLIVCFVSAIGATWIYGESLAPSYRAKARILIEDSTRWLGINDRNRVPTDWYMTQFQILRSKPIVTKVADRLEFDEPVSRPPEPLELLKSKLLRQPLDPAAHKLDRETLIPLVQRNIFISPQTSAGLVDVGMVAASPELARDVANALVATYVEENLRERIRLSMAGTEYLTERLSKISQRIQETEEALEDFERDEGIDIVHGLLPQDSTQLSEFIQKYVDTRSNRWELEERLKVLESVVRKADFTGIAGPVLKGSELANRSQALFEAQLALDKLEKQGYMAKHPKVVAAQDEIDTLRKRLMFESKALIAGLQTEHAALTQRERNLYYMIENLKPGANLARQQRARHEYLKREIEIQKGFYQSYHEKLKRLQLVDDVRPVSIRIVEAATTPARPFSPNKKFNMGVGIVVGLISGVFLAFLREYLDDTLKGADDVQSYLELPVIGTIPTISGAKEGRVLPGKLDTSPIVSEAYRTLRTNLQFFESERTMRAILVTSGGPAEGKSTTAANIALTLVQMGKRVCVIDTDLRKPIMHRLFQKPNQVGITSMFAGVTDKKKLIIRTGYDNLYLLPCGPLPPNPAELLASKRMEEAVRNLRKDFDYLIFDSPPVLAVTDALVLSSMVDGVLLVVRSASTRIGAAQQALDTLQSIKANVVGTVLNRVNPKQFGYYPYYYRYGGYGYGHDRGKTSKGKGKGKGSSRTETVAAAASGTGAAAGKS